MNDAEMVRELDRSIAAYAERIALELNPNASQADIARAQRAMENWGDRVPPEREEE